MGKKGLKSQLGAQKLLDSIEKSKSKPEIVAEKKEKKVQKSVEIIKPQKVKAKKTKKEDDYQSSALSKKESRKLKKQLKSQVEAEEPEEEKAGALLDDEAEEASDDEDEEGIDFEKLAESESESEIEDNVEDDDEEEDDEEEDDEEEKEDSEEEDIALSDVDVDSDADVVPHTKLTVNNVAALKDSLARIQLPWAKHSFVEHQSVASSEKTEASIKDIYDDTERELAFYKQGLDAVKQGRATLLKLKVPFSRPMDYFAEMVKSDEHMDKLKQKLLTEAANQKASEEAKKQRQLKKFGKQVQHETLQRRAKDKKETLEKVKSLKKKRTNNEFDDDQFQIALEEATSEDRGDNKRRKRNGKRLAKDSKYGFGGKKRGMRKNDAKSLADVSGFSAKKMKGKTARPGKSKRSRRN